MYQQFPRTRYVRIHSIHICGLGLGHFSALVCDLLSRMGVYPLISWKVGPHRSGALCWWTWYRLLGSPSRIWIWRSRWKRRTHRVFSHVQLRYPQFGPRGFRRKTSVRDTSIMCDTMKLISIGFGTLCWLPSQLLVPEALIGYTDVLIVREIDCGDWLAQECMPAHQHCGLFYPLVWGLA